MDLGQKMFIIWIKAEIIPNLLDVAPLVGPQPMKIRVVMFCTLPLVAPSQKCTCFDPSGHLKNGKFIFYVEIEKTLVAKVVGNAKMHISTKKGPWFHSLLWNLHKPWSPGKEDQENSCLEAPLCDRVHL
jgi:hypothetical protein